MPARTMRAASFTRPASAESALLGRNTDCHTRYRSAVTISADVTVHALKYSLGNGVPVLW